MENQITNPVTNPIFWFGRPAKTDISQKTLDHHVSRKIEITKVIDQLCNYYLQKNYKI